MSQSDNLTTTDTENDNVIVDEFTTALINEYDKLDVIPREQRQVPWNW